MTDPLQQLWREEAQDAHPPSPAELAVRARSLARRTHIRDGLEYASGLIVMLVFACYWATAANALVAGGCALTLAGTLIVMMGLWRRRVRAPADAGAEVGVGYLRGLLASQRAALASVGRWYLAPLVPGLLLFLAGVWVQIAERRTPAAATVAIGLTLAFVLVIFALILVANRRAAASLAAEIATLDREIANP